MRYISLFAGIGGFDLALNRLGHECVYANDFDKYAAQTYNKNFDHEIDTRSITEVSEGEIPDHDLLVGGFPCQAFSIAGKRRGFEDTRGTLFFDVARILKAKRPRYFILENVKGLLSHDNGNTFKTIISTITELGYDLQWQVLNSKNFGVPQNRERVFIVGHLRGERRRKIFPITRTNSKTLDYVGGILSEKNKLWLEDGKKFSRNFPQGQRVYSDKGVGSTLASNAGGLGGKTGLYFIDMSTKKAKLTKKARTPQARYRTAETSGVFDGRIRRLTPLECERLQGFPDGWTDVEYWTYKDCGECEECLEDMECSSPLQSKEKKRMSDTQRYKQLGNAVTVNVVYEVAKRLS